MLFAAEVAKRLHLWRTLDEEGLSGYDALAEAAVRCITRGGKIMFAGNGGSAADAQHLAAEYVGVGLPALALTTDSSVLTSQANDHGYHSVFAAQITALGQCDDLLVVHSTSGRSANIVRALHAARGVGISTAALLAGDGGFVAHKVDIAIVVPTRVVALAQEVHLAIGHMVWEHVKEAIADE